MTARAKYGLLAGMVSTIVVLDQTTKALVQRGLTLHESIPIIPDLFNLTYIRNPGAAFGLFASQPPWFRTVFFLTVSLVALGLLATIYWSAPTGSRLLRFGSLLVMGGAAGNLVDRVRYGQVVDFLDFYLGSYHWPAFNVADSCITVGVGLLLLHYARNRPGASAPDPIDSEAAR